MSERQHFVLSVREQDERGSLRPIPGEAFDFWRRVANKRGIDPGSIISNRNGFTGLPQGHRRAWCYPMRLKCDPLGTHD